MFQTLQCKKTLRKHPYDMNVCAPVKDKYMNAIIFPADALGEFSLPRIYWAVGLITPC